MADFKTAITQKYRIKRNQRNPEGTKHKKEQQNILRVGTNRSGREKN